MLEQSLANASYNAAGGLHGVGSSVVNALSLRLDVEVDRDGKTHHMAFHQGHPGVYSDADPEHPSPASPFKRTRKNKPTELEIIGTVSPKTTGTRVRYWADPEIFNSTAHFSYEQLIARVRQTSFLVPGLKITVIDEHVPEGESANIEEIDSTKDDVAENNIAENNLLENQPDNIDDSVSEFEELESETTLEDEGDSEDKTENIANEDETEDAESEESVAQSVANAQSANSMQNKASSSSS